MVSLALLQALSYSCSNLPFTLGPFPLPVLLRVCSLPLAGGGGRPRSNSRKESLRVLEPSFKILDPNSQPWRVGG